MIQNPVIEAMLNRKSIRKYTDRMPSDEVIETIVRAICWPRTRSMLAISRVWDASISRRSLIPTRQAVHY